MKDAHASHSISDSFADNPEPKKALRRSRGPNPRQASTEVPEDMRRQQQAKKPRAEPPLAPESPPVEVSMPGDSRVKAHMSSKLFSDLDISLPSRRALKEVLCYETMTNVQALSLPAILEGKDTLAKAKTGTGKTLAFLIPAVEKSLMTAPTTAQIQALPILILSPSRELAQQIAAEATALLSFHARQGVLCFVGGVSIDKDRRAMSNREGGLSSVALLVSTPGRLLDHLQNTAGFAQACAHLQFLVLDEADQLLDMGFKPALDAIVGYLPPSRKRQTLCFSATVAPAVRHVANAFLRPGYAFIDTVGEEAEQTHGHVAQQLCSVGMEDLLPALLAVVQQQTAERPHKVLVFFTTARAAGFSADLCGAMGMPVLQIHSRMSQAARSRTSEQFRAGSNLVMFSSDVSARGMDYPDVTFVLQVGSTEKAQYIHRLGRTARAGKGGAGMLLLQDFEERAMLRELQDLPLQRLEREELRLDAHRAGAARGVARVQGDPSLRTSAEQAYRAMLGYYNGKLRALGWSKEELVQRANAYARVIGLQQVPALEKKTVGLMGLKGVPGLRVVAS
jgi:ATP-dependent RNA helicase MSS116